MNRKKIWAVTAIAAACAAMHGAAYAQDGETSGGDEGFFGSLFSGVDISFGGFIRPEMAVATGDANWTNQNGNTYNGRSIDRQAYVPPTFIGKTINLPVIGPVVSGLQDAVTSWKSLPVPGILASDASSQGLRGVNSQTDPGTGKPIKTDDNTFNFAIVRAEAELGMRFSSDFNLVARLRGIYDPTVYDEFNAHDYDNVTGGITGGNRALYSGRPNYFDYDVEGGGHSNPLEWTGRNYQIYFPALFLEYTHGPLTVRAGNQQIAWGQAIFFRVFDVVDGLDLRRHSLLDNAQEEFSDKRVPALALRMGYQINDDMLMDAFVQKFQPTIYGNPNTQYNVIPTQFTVHDMYKEGGYDDKISYGLRFKADYGKWGFQAMAVDRYNPDGVFRWTKSGVNKDLPNQAGTLGALVNTSLGLTGRTSGEILQDTAFEASPGGVYSAQEWFDYAAQVRLKAVDGLNSAIDEFPAAQEIYASHAGDTQEAINELNTFFIAGGGALRGHIAREYYREQVYGLGTSYVVDGEPGSILDQLIINLEVSYTPNRAFTSPSLAQKPLKQDNTIAALVLEKYQRFSQSFPATYMVLQYMHRTKDDLFGRSLEGYGGTVDKQASGVNGSDYVVFAFQQPFPQDIYRASMAVLYDPRGGILVQPGIKWKPRGEITVDAFYSYINGDMGGNPNKNALSTINYADEFTMRLTYQF